MYQYKIKIKIEYLMYFDALFLPISINTVSVILTSILRTLFMKL